MDNRFKLLIVPAAALAFTNCQKSQSPNVLLIITDDQGYGDLGFTGNPHLATPNIDKLAGESIRFNNFYVCPVSAPTRSSLMTGRYSLRTGVHDTYNGGAIMAANEVTIAEILKEKGYRTGIFGKWHLGDSYPCRPIDQGFEESIVHLGGGMGQPGDFTTFIKGDSSYFNPVLWHNGKQESFKGYCSDIFAGEAIDFINESSEKPFFCYLAFNAPHTPLQVPGEYYSLFRDIDPSSGFENDSIPFNPMNENNKEDARRVYAMVKNIDENIGRILQKLGELNLDENTIVIFMTDNGPQQMRYNAGMRGLKASVYRGGVRVPFFLRYPRLGTSVTDINTTAANIDILPTLAELCGARVPSDRKIDGKSLVPLMKGEDVDWKDRSLFFYWTRAFPELYNNVALQKGKYKLAGHTDYDSDITGFELYDIEDDPYEQNNIIHNNISLSESLKEEFDSYYKELVNSPNLTDPQRIIIGNANENPVYLNRNDAGGDRGIWTQEEIFGKWRVKIEEGTYNIRCHFLDTLQRDGQMIIETGTIINQKRNPQEGLIVLEMNNIKYPQMDCDFIPFYQSGAKRILPFWIDVERIK